MAPALCPSCLHRFPIGVKGLIFCRQEQALTHPHLVCLKFSPSPDASPDAVKEHDRRLGAYRAG